MSRRFRQAFLETICSRRRTTTHQDWQTVPVARDVSHQGWSAAQRSAVAVARSPHHSSFARDAPATSAAATAATAAAAATQDERLR